MSNNHRLALPVVVGAVAVVLAGCAAKTVQTPTVAAPVSTHVVLLKDAETDAVGRALVTNASGTVELDSDRAATTAIANSAPNPSHTLSDADVARMFGDALQALPLPSARFTLNFRLGSEELTDESRAQITDVIQAIQRRSAPYVTLVGHTDTTGKETDNLALGLARTHVVRDLLLRSGLPASSIELLSLGERDPLIQTADETPEQRNRRVEIAVR